MVAPEPCHCLAHQANLECAGQCQAGYLLELIPTDSSPMPYTYTVLFFGLMEKATVPTPGTRMELSSVLEPLTLMEPPWTEPEPRVLPVSREASGSGSSLAAREKSV